METARDQGLKGSRDMLIIAVGLVFTLCLLVGLALGYLLDESMETNISKEWPVVVVMALVTYPPLYSKRLRKAKALGKQDDRQRANSYAGWMFACLMFWMFFSEGLCVRLDVAPGEPKVYEAVVIEKSMHNGMTRYVTVLDRQGDRHQLRMHDASPGIGQQVVFSAREGLLGVLYDINPINY